MISCTNQLLSLIDFSKSTALFLNQKVLSFADMLLLNPELYCPSSPDKTLPFYKSYSSHGVLQAATLSNTYPCRHIYQLAFIFVPGHEGVMGNETVDLSAVKKEGQGMDQTNIISAVREELVD